jgi:hypothetical protein
LAPVFYFDTGCARRSVLSSIGTSKDAVYRGFGIPATDSDMADAPRPDEILVVLAIADGGRLFNRCSTEPFGKDQSRVGHKSAHGCWPF